MTTKALPGRSGRIAPANGIGHNWRMAMAKGGKKMGGYCKPGGKKK
jgi:hypothetical protein